MERTEQENQRVYLFLSFYLILHRAAFERVYEQLLKTDAPQNSQDMKTQALCWLLLPQYLILEKEVIDFYKYGVILNMYENMRTCEMRAIYHHFPEFTSNQKTQRLFVEKLAYMIREKERMIYSCKMVCMARVMVWGEGCGIPLEIVEHILLFLPPHSILSRKEMIRTSKIAFDGRMMGRSKSVFFEYVFGMDLEFIFKNQFYI